MNNNPSTPQKYLTLLTQLLIGLMYAGNIVGVLNDTFDFIILPISIVGTISILLFGILADPFLRVYPWQTIHGPIDKLRPEHKIFLLGMIVLLWIPPGYFFIYRNIVPPTTAVPNSFIYQIRVTDQNLENKDNAQVTIETGGKLPESVYTDVNGIAYFYLDNSWQGNPGKIRVQLTGYQIYVESIDIEPQTSLKDIQLQADP